MAQATYRVELRNLPLRHAAVVKFTARVEEMSSKMPDAFGRVTASLSERGIQTEGPAVARYLRQGEAFEVEAGFYVTQHVEEDDGVRCIELPAGEVLATTHTGPYYTLPAAYAAVQANAREHHRELSESMWEEYWSDPSMPSSEWRTDVIWPLKAG
ncbi:MAG TPA: GyrI-like domain-containing protein [Dehalococcoidia bacterium]|nr:GyrI-like domain-containing protein [Dehalococcoidia bacterium]